MLGSEEVSNFLGLKDTKLDAFTQETRSFLPADDEITSPVKVIYMDESSIGASVRPDCDILITKPNKAFQSEFEPPVSKSVMQKESSLHLSSSGREMEERFDDFLSNIASPRNTQGLRDTLKNQLRRNSKTPNHNKMVKK